PLFEHDACGLGFVAEPRPRPSCRIIPLALQALAGLTHRGAIAGDAKTGDGAGIAIPLAEGLVERITAEAGIAVPAGRRIAVGMVFLPGTEPSRSRGRALVEAALVAEDLAPLGCRVVPIDRSVLCSSARGGVPGVVLV